MTPPLTIHPLPPPPPSGEIQASLAVFQDPSRCARWLAGWVSALALDAPPPGHLTPEHRPHQTTVGSLPERAGTWPPSVLLHPDAPFA